MKPLLLILFSAAALNVVAQNPQKVSVTHVNTAMDHVTVLEFSDPVTKVAAGSSGFQIERDGNTVLIKPLRLTASTDLLVWTSNNRYAYELDPPGDIKSMNFAIDAPTSNPPVASQHENHSVTDVADMVLVKSMLGMQKIGVSRVKEASPIALKVLNIFQTADSIYVQFSMVNRGSRPIRASVVNLAQLVRAQREEVSVQGLVNSQLGEEDYPALGKVAERQLPISRIQFQKEALDPGDEGMGVLVMRRTFNRSVVLQLTVTTDDSQSAKAIVVFL